MLGAWMRTLLDVPHHLVRQVYTFGLEDCGLVLAALSLVVATPAEMLASVAALTSEQMPLTSEQLRMLEHAQRRMVVLSEVALFPAEKLRRRPGNL